jgi:hypothetical protein
MMQVTRIFQSQEVTGSPVRVGDITVTPQSRALIVRLRFGGLVWRRPTAVLVERAGQTSRIPIVDVTRVVQLAPLGVAWSHFGRCPDPIQSTRRKGHGNGLDESAKSGGESAADPSDDCRQDIAPAQAGAAWGAGHQG